MMVDIKVGDRIYIKNYYLSGLDVNTGIITNIDGNKITLSNGKSYINTNRNSEIGFAFEDKYTGPGVCRESLHLTNNEWITKLHIERCIEDYTKLVMKKLEKTIYKNKSISNLNKIIGLLEEVG